MSEESEWYVSLVLRRWLSESAITQSMHSCARGNKRKRIVLANVSGYLPRKISRKLAMVDLMEIKVAKAKRR